MARVSFPRFGEIEGGPLFVVGVLAMIVVAALVGLSIWTGGDSSDAPTPSPPTTVDGFAEDWIEDLADGCADGFMEDCNDLYFETLPGSQLESFGATCGGRNDWDPGNC